MTKSSGPKNPPTKSRAPKKRLDQLLVDLELAPSRAKAQAMILAGEVVVDDLLSTKAGTAVSPSSSITINSKTSRYVSRGGDKIAAAFDKFEFLIKDSIALDVGSSTGGFTDFMLQHGASKVYAVDVGTNQLDFRLREDARVVLYEKTNVKALSLDMFEELPTLCTVDLSFIGVSKILSFIIPVLKSPFSLIILVKPQFELEPEYVEKGGVVRNEQHQLLAVEKVREVAEKLGLTVVDVVPSPLKGEKSGNQEYFLGCTG